MAIATGFEVVASLDELDKAIIAELQEDGRRPYADVGRAVGLSESAVRQRVGQLRNRGALQIVAVTDPLALGLRLIAMIAIRASGDVEAIAEALASIPSVEYVVITAGGFDIVAEAVCENEAELLELLNKRVRAIPGVATTESFIYLKIQKQEYSWGRTSKGGRPPTPRPRQRQGRRA